MDLVNACGLASTNGEEGWTPEQTAAAIARDVEENSCSPSNQRLWRKSPLGSPDRVLASVIAQADLIRIEKEAKARTAIAPFVTVSRGGKSSSQTGMKAEELKKPKKRRLFPFLGRAKEGLKLW